MPDGYVRYLFAGFIDRMKCVNISADGKVIKRFDDEIASKKTKYEIRAGNKGQMINITKDYSSSGIELNKYFIGGALLNVSMTVRDFHAHFTLKYITATQIT